MKIAVLGAGAMGSLFGGCLAQAGFEVQLVDVNVAHIDAVRAAGLRLEDDGGDRRVPVAIGRAAEFDAPVDLLVVFTKGPYTEAALQSAAHLVGPSTWAMTLQNGLGNGERLAAHVAPGRVIVGMTNWPADYRGPGHVHSHGDGEVRLWTFDGHEDAQVEAIAAALTQAGLNAHADREVTAAIWEKAAFNAAMNSIASVTGFTVGQMADDPDIPGLAASIVEEAAAVALARGVAVSPERITRSVRHAYAEHRPHKPSMLQDILAGRPTEIESINGAIVEQARLAGVKAPTIEALARLVRAKQRQALL